VPIDPITGKPFAYRTKNGKAILESPAPLNRPEQGLHWEITVKNDTASTTTLHNTLPLDH